MKRCNWLLLLAAVLAFSLAIGCGGDDDDDDDDNGDDDDAGDDDDDDDAGCDFDVHDPLIVAGKQALGDGLTYEAFESFDDALAACPDSLDAKMGIALVDQMALERQLASLLGWLVNVFGETKSAGAIEPQSFGTILQAILLSDFLPKAMEMESYAGEILDDAPADWTFWIDSYPFILQGETVDHVWVDLGGEWDRADVTILQAEANAYVALVRLLDAYDLTLDWYWIRNLPSIDIDPLDPGTWPGALHSLTGWLLDVIEDPDYPMFLLLKGEYGIDSVTEAGVALADAMDGAVAASMMALEETDDQTDDIAGYVDENGNGAWDEGEPFFLPYIGTLSADQDRAYWGFLGLFETLAASIRDGGEYDETPGEPDEVLLSDFNFILEALGFEPLLPPIGGSVGPLYNDPDPVWLKELLRTWVRFLYEATAPVNAEEGLQ